MTALLATRPGLAAAGARSAKAAAAAAAAAHAAQANAATAHTGWTRRARPLLGTLVDIGLAPGSPAPAAALAAAFDAIAAVQAALSRFDAASPISRFQHLPAGASLPLPACAQRVLHAAQALQQASGGLFDISLGSGPAAWRCQAGRLHKLQPGVQLDLGGIAKGFAVDAAMRALQRAGCPAAWVNAGGDLRVYGDVALPLHLRDAQHGGVRPLGQLRDGALATSRFAPGSRSGLHRPLVAGGLLPPARPGWQVSVAAPRALWADALTKIVAASGDVQHPLLTRLGASAWLIVEQPSNPRGDQRGNQHGG